MKIIEVEIIVFDAKSDEDALKIARKKWCKRLEGKLIQVLSYKERNTGWSGHVASIDSVVLVK